MACSLLCALPRLLRPDSARMAGVFLLIGYAVSISLCSAQSSVQFNVKDNSGAPVSGAVVMVQPQGGVTIASRLVKRDIAVDQVDREFIPKLSIAALGARLSFPNRDIVQHSVYSFSKAKSFEIPIYAGESPQVITLDKAGVITLGCNIHDWMVGYIVVADTPIAELTKADGTVIVTELARGKYNLRVWHPQLKTGDYTQAFELGDTELRVDVKLELTPQRTRYKPPLKIKSY
jgi:plastocyanin